MRIRLRKREDAARAWEERTEAAPAEDRMQLMNAVLVFLLDLFIFSMTSDGQSYSILIMLVIICGCVRWGVEFCHLEV